MKRTLLVRYGNHGADSLNGYGQVQMQKLEQYLRLFDSKRIIILSAKVRWAVQSGAVLKHMFPSASLEAHEALGRENGNWQYNLLQYAYSLIITRKNAYDVIVVIAGKEAIDQLARLCVLRGLGRQLEPFTDIDHGKGIIIDWSTCSVTQIR